MKWAKTPEVGLPKPDVVVFLDLAPEDAEKRGGYGEEKYEKKEMQQRVRKLFLSLLDLRIGDEKHDMKVINAGETVEVVEDRIWIEVSKVLELVVDGRKGEVEKAKAWSSVNFPNQVEEEDIESSFSPLTMSYERTGGTTYTRKLPDSS